MKKQFMILLLLAAFGFSVRLNAQTATAPSTGDGSSGTPYEIATWENLYWISQDISRWNKHYIQTADIDLSTASPAITGWDSNQGWTPIGNGTTQFTGSYDGQGFTINGLYINRPSTIYAGLFGRIANSTISNLGVTDVNITAYANVGGLVGRSDGSSVQNSYSTGSVSGINTIGGLVGYILSSSIMQNSYSTCSVSASSGNIGGLVGYNHGSTVQNSYSTGSVSGYNYIGGFVGYIETGAMVRNSYSTGSVSGNNHIGGFVGRSYSGTIQNSYSAGFVSGSGDVGGLLGSSGGSAPVTNSFWDKETSNQSNSAGGTDKTTSEMKDWATFTNTLTLGLTSAWDFVTNPYDDVANNDYWDMDQVGTVNNGYPILSWQTGADNILPVELTNFSGMSTSKGVLLNWRTQTETDNAGFILLRNGAEIASFEYNDALKGHGTTSQSQSYTHTDSDVSLESTYTYQLVSVDYSGTRHSYSQTVEVKVVEAITSGKPIEYALEQNYPNPFNPSTTITYTMKKPGVATLKVYDMLGRLVIEQTKASVKGQNQINFNGSKLTSGMYYYQLNAEGFSKTLKMTLVK